MSGILSGGHYLFKNLKDQALHFIEVFGSLKYPDFKRETDFIALKGDKKYEFLNGPLTSSKTGVIEISRYKEYIEEYTPLYSNSKACKRNGKGFMVGALSRMNLNYDLIEDDVKSLVEKTGIEFPNKNPHIISFVQIVEVAHLITRGIEILKELKNTELKPEKNNFEVKEGEGIAVTEAPRGLLLSVSAFGLSVIVTMLIVVALSATVISSIPLENSVVIGIILGAIVGGTSSPIVIPLASRLKNLQDKTKMISSLHSDIVNSLTTNYK